MDSRYDSSMWAAVFFVIFFGLTLTSHFEAKRKPEAKLGVWNLLKILVVSSTIVIFLKIFLQPI